MHVISKKSLLEFWTKHPRAEVPLVAWWKRTSLAEWRTFEDLKNDFPHADRYKQFVIFDIGGNKYRLIAAVHYNRQKVYVRHVLTHAEYSQGDWKT